MPPCAACLLCTHVHSVLRILSPSMNACTLVLSLSGKGADIEVGMQDDTLAAQAALEKQLAAVGDDVEDINTRVGEVRSLLHPAQHMLLLDT